MCVCVSVCVWVCVWASHQGSEANNFFFFSFTEKAQARQKVVRFDDTVVDTERTAYYNLRPRKRKNLSEHEGQAEKADLRDSSSTTKQLKGRWKSSQRKPTPYPLSWREMKRSEAQVSSAQTGEGNKSLKRKTTRYGQRRKRRKVLCNREKEFLGAVREGS